MNESMGEPRVSLEEVRHVAALANLELTEVELPRMAKDLDAVLGYIDQLGELDTGAVPLTDQTSVVMGPAQTEGGEALRQDSVRPSLDRDLVLAEAPEADGRFFKVPKVIER